MSVISIYVYYMEGTPRNYFYFIEKQFIVRLYPNKKRTPLVNQRCSRIRGLKVKAYEIRRIICPAEEQRRPSISSDRPIQRLYPKHISLFRMRLRRTDPAELPGWG